MIKLVLLTGFLGAGKTTLMKEILEGYRDKKTGVIVNEFGEINIDAKLLSKEGIQIAELSNGSIFCACIKDKFVDSLIEMSLREIEYLFIEASGLADPSNIDQILAGIKDKVLHRYDYKGSICILDGESFVDLYQVLPAITSQLEFCSAAIINKGDLIDEDQLKGVLDIVHQINPEVVNYVTSYCKVDVVEIVESIRRTDKKARDSGNTEETRPTTFILKGLETIPLAKLEQFLAEICGAAYRIKGFVATDRGNKEVSAVGKKIQIKEWPASVEKSELVVISAVGFKMMSILTKAIDNYVKGIIRI